MKLDSEGLWTDSPGSITVGTGKGRRVDLFNIKPEDVSIADLSHALSRLCRYNGHVGYFLSVARHSIWVSQAVEASFGPHEDIDWDLVQLGLLHDCAEAYIGDMVRPLKHGLTGVAEAYLALEASIESVIAERFNLPYPHPDIIKWADNNVLLNRELGGEEARWTWSSNPNRDKNDFMTRYWNIERWRMK